MNTGGDLPESFRCIISIASTKNILEPIWTYGIPLWSTASNSNVEILQRYQNKVLRATVNAPWYKPNKVLHIDLKVQTMREEITKFSVKHSGKSLARPGRKQSNVSVRMARISFGALPCEKKKRYDSSRLDGGEITRVPDMLPSLLPSWPG